MVRVAALDLGTNTFRLLVAEVKPDDILKPLRKAQIITRLGGGFDTETGKISPDAIDRAGEALEKFAKIMREEKPDAVLARATAIVRRASNGDEFLGMASRLLAVEVDTLPAWEEAALALRGILAYNPPVSRPFITLDIGGGSTELALAGPGGLEGWVSLQMGVVELVERVLSDSDPPSAGSLKRCELEIRFCVESARGKLGAPTGISAIIGTGGAATSLAAVSLGLDEYDEAVVQNHRLSYDEVRKLEGRLALLSFSERGAIFPLGGGREDVIIPGAIITRVTLEIFGSEEMLVSDAGLLEGLALAGAEN